MLEGFLHLFSRRPAGSVLTDIADILLVAYILYRALLVLRGTRAMQMGLGLGVIFLVYLVSKWADFTTLLYVLNALPIILIVVVVFQNDIRRGLMRVGARAFLAGLSRQQESRVIDEVVSAATDLARHRIGALIAFEQDANLDEFVVGQGTPIDATVQRELIVSLFLPESLNKLHDGAVVIRNLRIAKAGVFFPMPDTKVLDKSLGSRHRAALGITEETDAVVVVVSEERGTISFCFNGNVVTNLDGASLRQALLGLFGQSGARKRSKTAAKRVGTVTQTGTGSFRISVPPSSQAEPRSTRAAEPAPAPPGATAETTGSAILAPPVPRGEAKPEKDAPAVSKAITRPMAPAKPIETPKPMVVDPETNRRTEE
ncbi:MAG TPA: diadenylate cyclase CdaA [Polyangiaceae bacterium]|nr:diadenylate cyclase CdaA [Polyangiaceae bacterium]